MLDDKEFFGQVPGFWLHRRVLITGHTSFLGSWLAARLSGLGADLQGFDRVPAAPGDLFTLAGLDRHVEGRTLDLRDRARVEQLVVAAAPEIVFHLAAAKGSGAGLKRPLDSFDTGAIGTLNVLNAVRRVPGIRAVVTVTSDLVYRPGEALVGEAAPLAGRGPAAASLACAELVVESYRATYLQPVDGIGLATVRPAALIGGGGTDDCAPAGLLRRYATGDAAAAAAGARARRPFLHVLDGLEALLALAEALTRAPGPFARSWNLAPLDHAACFAAMAELAGPAESGKVAAPRLDGTALARALGWQPALDARAAIDWTVEGDRRLAGEGHGGFLFDQIDRLAAKTSTTPQADGARRPMPPASLRASDDRIPA